MTAPPTPRTIRIAYDPPADVAQLSQRRDGRMCTIEPSTIEVNYYLSLTPHGPVTRWYVIVQGRKRRQVDGGLSRTYGRIAYWPDHADHAQRIEASPTWVADLVSDAHRLTGDLAGAL